MIEGFFTMNLPKAELGAWYESVSYIFQLWCSIWARDRRIWGPVWCKLVWGFHFCSVLDRPVMVNGSLIRFKICAKEYQVSRKMALTAVWLLRRYQTLTVKQMMNYGGHQGWNIILRFPFCWQNLSWQIIFRPWPSWLGQFRRFYKFK